MVVRHIKQLSLAFVTDNERKNNDNHNNNYKRCLCNVCQYKCVAIMSNHKNHPKCILLQLYYSEGMRVGGLCSYHLSHDEVITVTWDVVLLLGPNVAEDHDPRRPTNKKKSKKQN